LKIGTGGDRGGQPRRKLQGTQHKGHGGSKKSDGWPKRKKKRKKSTWKGWSQREGEVTEK